MNKLILAVFALTTPLLLSAETQENTLHKKIIDLLAVKDGFTNVLPENIIVSRQQINNDGVDDAVVYINQDDFCSGSEKQRECRVLFYKSQPKKWFFQPEKWVLYSATQSKFKLPPNGIEFQPNRTKFNDPRGLNAFQYKNTNKNEMEEWWPLFMSFGYGCISKICKDEMIFPNFQSNFQGMLNDSFSQEAIEFIVRNDSYADNNQDNDFIVPPIISLFQDYSLNNCEADRCLSAIVREVDEPYQFSEPKLIELDDGTYFTLYDNFRKFELLYFGPAERNCKVSGYCNNTGECEARCGDKSIVFEK